MALKRVPNIFRMSGCLVPGSLYTGKTFNSHLAGRVCIKLFVKDEIHHGYQYKSGTNVIDKFIPRGECQVGGFYFFTKDELNTKSLLYFINFKISHIRIVSIPNDAKVYVEYGKYKTDKIVLGKRLDIDKEFPEFRDICERAVSIKTSYLEIIPPEIVTQKMREIAM